MAAGTLDSTFGTGGEIVIAPGNILSGGVQPLDSIVQADGKTITIGTGFSFTVGGYFTQLKRYNTDGTLDTSFGTGGKVDASSGYFGAKQQSDGKLILLSRVSAFDISSNVVLTRYNSNGTLDNTFGTSGKLTTDVAGYTFIDERNGKILLGAGGATTATLNTTKVNLYNSDGSLDNTFGTNGTISIAGSGGVTGGGIVQTDGKLLLSFGNIKRYNRDGSLDTTFGYDGVLVASGNLSQQSDGKILVNDGSKVKRYNLDGSRDYTFGTEATFNSLGKIILEGDGKIVTAGSKSGIAGNQQDFFLSRFNNNGILDSTFGTSGTASVDFAKGNDVLSNLALGNDGKIFVSGQTTPPSGVASFASASLLNDLSATTNHAPVVANKLTSKVIVSGTAFNLNIPSNTFSDTDVGDTLTYTAIAKTFLNSVFASAPLTFNAATSSFSIAPNGYTEPIDIQVTATDKGGLSAISDFKLTVASSSVTAANLDPTFGVDGSYSVSVDRVGGLINTTGAVVQADGKVVVNRADGFTGIKLTRYNTDGSRDLTFKNSTIANALNSGLAEMIQQSDGKILVRGLKGVSEGLIDYNNYALSRFNSDGSVDTAFGTNGSIVTNLNLQSYSGTFSESNGKIYMAAGLKQSGSVQSPLQLNRYNSDGSVDNTFGTSGAVIIDNTSTSNKEVNAIQQQADGKALVAVNIGGSNGADYLFRYNSNGSIDTTFGTNGRVTISLASGIRPYQILQQSDGKILVTQSNRLKRYNLDGSIDSTFAGSGTIVFSETISNSTRSFGIRKVMQQSDGKLIVDIVRSTADPNRLLRYNLDGTIDNTFTGDFAGDTVFNITQESDGKIVAVGTAPATGLFGGSYIENVVATRYANGIVAPPPNNPPVVANAIATKTATTGTAFNFILPTNTFSDPDAGDTLTYAATLADGKALPTWLTFNATTGLFTGTPASTDVGTLNLRVKATDKAGLSVTNDFGLSIAAATAVNRSPVVANLIMSTAVNQGNLFNFTLPATTFSDPDLGDTLTYTAKLANGNPLPTWVSFNATTGVFSGTPTATDVGNVVFQIKATDKGGLSVTTDFGLTIVGTNSVNNAPVVANPIAAKTATSGTTFNFTLPTNTFSDPDAGDSLTYTATLADGKALPTWLNFNATTGVFSGTPTISDVGNLSLSVKATDKGGLSVTNNFGLSIAAATATNRPPVVADAIANKTATSGTLFSYTIPSSVFVDPDPGDLLTYKATLINESPLPSWLSFNAATGVFSGTPATGDVGNLNIRVTATDKGGLSVNNEFGVAISSTVTPNPSVVLGLSIINNLFSSDANIKGFGIKAVSQKPTNKVSELVMFAVDDATGKIGTLLPGTAGYLKAALDRAKPLFSTLGGSFFSPDTQQVAVTPTSYQQLIEIQDGSIADLQQQLAKGITPTNVLYSLADANGNSPIKVTETSTKDGYQISINNDELVLSINPLTGGVLTPQIGTRSQTLAEGRTIDLTDYANQTLKVDLTTKSDAGYNNNIGFYQVEDATGTIRLTDGTSIGITDVRYAVEAVKQAIANSSLAANKTDSKTGQNIAGGKLYAPVLVSQGNFNDFISTNPTNSGTNNAIHAYFNYVGANPDKIDHFRLLGANTFGAEDLYGGGDRDFNDVVINLKIST